MHKSVLAGAVALALLGTLSFTGTHSAQAAGPAAAAQAGMVVTDAHIAHLKAALRLTPAQEPYWPAVESALRNVVLPGPSGGLLQEVRNNVAVLKRLAQIATPLVRTLDATQKRSAVQAARAMGFGHLARAF
jgi:hypothetical protein